MLQQLLIFYWTFSLLFSIGYFSLVMQEEKDIWTKILLVISCVLLGGIMLPVYLGNFIGKQLNK